MPTYVVLINFTDQGIRNVKQTIIAPAHVAAANASLTAPLTL